MRRRMLTWVALAAALLVGLKLLVLVLEPRMAFFPWRGEQATPQDEGIPFRALKLATSDGETLHAWILPHPAARAEVLYWHGNGGNLSLWLDVLAPIYRRGLTVVALDYRGYGLSTGTPSEQGLYRDTDALLEHYWSAGHEPGRPVVYWGRSIGGSVAAYAAAKKAPDGLIVESSFTHVGALLAGSPVLRFLSLFSTYRFPTTTFLEQVRCPVLVIHGDEDEIVPFDNGRRLYDAIAGEKRFARIAGARHNDLHLVDPASYWREIDAFLDAIGIH